MDISQFLNFLRLRFDLNTVFFLLAIFVVAYVVWDESKKNGFSEEKSFDLFFFSTAFGFVVGRLFFGIFSLDSIFGVVAHLYRVWIPGFDVFGFLFGNLVAIFFVTKKWNWSIYRTLDIYSLAYPLGIAVVLVSGLTKNLSFSTVVLFVSYVFLFVLFNILKKALIRSGVLFSLFLLSNVPLGLLFYRDTRHLIFYFILVTLSIVNIYYRNKRSAMKTPLSPELIKKFKTALLGKKKNLEQTQELLKSQDPYMAEGRDNDNAEYMEDAILEDQRKTDIDAQLSIVSRMRAQVSRALNMIKAGKYGTCEICGEPIDKARLNVYPEATTCIKHADKNS